MSTLTSWPMPDTASVVPPNINPKSRRRQRRSGNFPARPSVTGLEKFNVKNDGTRDAVHGEIAVNISCAIPRPLNRSAVERDNGKSLDRKEVCAAQMFVPFPNTGVDAVNLDPRGNSGTLRLIPIKVDRSRKSMELPANFPEEVTKFKTDFRMFLIEFVALCRLQRSGRHPRKRYKHQSAEAETQVHASLNVQHPAKLHER